MSNDYEMIFDNANKSEEFICNVRKEMDEFLKHIKIKEIGLCTSLAFYYKEYDGIERSPHVSTHITIETNRWFGDSACRKYFSNKCLISYIIYSDYKKRYSMIKFYGQYSEYDKNMTTLINNKSTNNIQVKVKNINDLIQQIITIKDKTNKEILK